MQTTARWSVLSLMVAVLPWLSGCAISTPFKVVKSAGLPDEKVLVVITQGTVNPSIRSEFDRQTQRVLARMGSQPGLIAYSARRELPGPGIWTVSVWETDAARAAFYISNAHQEAMAMGGDAIETVRFRRVWLPRREMPTDWTAVLQLLAKADADADATATAQTPAPPTSSKNDSKQ